MTTLEKYKKIANLPGSTWTGIIEPLGEKAMKLYKYQEMFLYTSAAMEKYNYPFTSDEILLINLLYKYYKQNNIL